MISENNILILTQWSFKDALIQTYTLPYVDIIRSILPPESKILVVTAEQPHLAITDSEKAIQRNEWENRNMELIALPYKKFGVKKIIAGCGQLYHLFRVIKKNKITIIHAFCTPAGSLGYLLSKMTGTRLIIDSYEPHAESMVENGTWTKNGLAFKILFSLEKRMTRKAIALIGTTDGMKTYAFEKYGVEVKRFYVKPACVDRKKFFPREKDALLKNELQLENKIVCVYAGKLGGIYLREEIFDFIGTCYEHWKDNFRFLMLTNAKDNEIKEQASRIGLPDNIIINRFVMHREIPRYLSLGDFALNPVKPVPTKKYCTSIKDGEYWAMGLPVIISPNISDDSEIIEREKIGVVLNFYKPEEFSRTVRLVEPFFKNQSELKLKISSVAEKYRSFDLAKKVYKNIYQDLN